MHMHMPQCVPSRGGSHSEGRANVQRSRQLPCPCLCLCLYLGSTLSMSMSLPRFFWVEPRQCQRFHNRVISHYLCILGRSALLISLYLWFISTICKNSFTPVNNLVSASTNWRKGTSDLFLQYLWFISLYLWFISTVQRFIMQVVEGRKEAGWIRFNIQVRNHS